MLLLNKEAEFMHHNQISTSEESYGHLRGVTRLLLGGVLKVQFQGGQSLMEVIIAATVGILVVSALTFATIFSLRNAGFAKTSAQATKLAQEGIERVRTGRNRNAAITGNFRIGENLITSWNGDANGDGALWGAQINGNCIPNCYFNVTNQSVLNYLGPWPTMPSGAEPIPPLFKRVVILSDDANWQTQKKVTVIVTWTDSSGPHESKLTTILGKTF